MSRLWVSIETFVSNFGQAKFPTGEQRACLIQGHLHGEALIVYIGDCRAIHIEQNKGAVVSDDAAPLAVNLLQMLPAQPAIAI